MMKSESIENETIKETMLLWNDYVEKYEELARMLKAANINISFLDEVLTAKLALFYS